MKYVPLDTPAIPLNGGEALTTKALILWALRNDQRFNSDGVGIRSAARIEDAVESAEPEGVALEHNDHERLKEALESPRPVQGGTPYPLNPASKLAPHIDAVSEAKTHKPNEKVSTNGKPEKNAAEA